MVVVVNCESAGVAGNILLFGLTAMVGLVLGFSPANVDMLQEQF